MPNFKCGMIKLWQADFPLRLSFSHHLASRRRVDTLIVEIASVDGTVGYGQALPREYLTGETIATVAEAVRSVLWPRLSAFSLSSSAGPDDVLAALEPLYRDADAGRLNSSYAAVEMALLDAFAKENGIPAVFGARRPGGVIPLVGVITAGGSRKAFWLARAMRFLGYRHFKVKVGLDADADARRLEAVRRAAGRGATVLADANQAWGWEEAIVRMAGLRREGVALVEEPLNRETAAVASFSELERAAGLPTMADETLCTTADAGKLLARGSPAWWNLRLGKNGGLNSFFKLAALARKNAICLYNGILVGETSIMAAAARTGMFAIRAECAEYGFPRVFIRGDPFRGGPGGWRGGMPAPDFRVSGFGVRLVSSRLSKRAHLLWSGSV